MKIRCKLERDGGTPVLIGDTTYHFCGDAGAHVAEVTNEEHARRLLNIPEGYEPFGVEVVEMGGSAPPVLVERATVDAVVAASDFPDAPHRRSANAGPDYNGLTRKQLEAAFEAKFKKKPHPRAKDSTLLAALTGNG